MATFKPHLDSMFSGSFKVVSYLQTILLPGFKGNLTNANLTNANPETFPSTISLHQVCVGQRPEQSIFYVNTELGYFCSKNKPDGS